MTLFHRTVLMVTALLAGTVIVTALTLAAAARQALLDQTAEQGKQLARVLARGAHFAGTVPLDVERAIGEQMLVQATITAHLVATAERAGLSPDEIIAMLRDVTDRTVLDEFWITDASGHAYLRNMTHIDFTFSPDPTEQPQASAFWPLLVGEKSEVVQEARVREVDDAVFKYAGVSGVDGRRIVQVGYNAEMLDRLREEVGLERLVAELVRPPGAPPEAEEPAVAAIHVVDRALVTLAYSAAEGLSAATALTAAEEAAVRQVVGSGTTLTASGRDVLKVFAPIHGADGRVTGVTLVTLATGHVRRAIERQLGLALALAAAVLSAGVLASLVLARRVTRPVAALSAAARALQAGQFDPASLEPVGRRADELGQLARVFGHMAEEVAAREARLRRQIDALRIEIDDQRRQRDVAEITDTDYFRELRRRGQALRRGGDAAPDAPSAGG
jgi:HAMP domain-containing protein